MAESGPRQRKRFAYSGVIRPGFMTPGPWERQGRGAAGRPGDGLQGPGTFTFVAKRAVQALVKSAEAPAPANAWSVTFPTKVGPAAAFHGCWT